MKARKQEEGLILCYPSSYFLVPIDKLDEPILRKEGEEKVGKPEIVWLRRHRQLPRLRSPTRKNTSRPWREQKQIMYVLHHITVDCLGRH